ncbi:unnamed protein product [Phytophthora lilii]|uniref:Unnamed protein product n=1 Tax=Phytophthora lilii TaxID=2077276 RepID=A0A9W7CP81_9STRA|nr:unnamed protein product [Phytophthora lilii]
MGNSAGRHIRDRDVIDKMHKGLYATGPANTKHPAKTDAKTIKKTPNSTEQGKKKKGNTQQKAAGASTKKGKKSKAKGDPTQPRKGRKESFSKYIPGYFPTVPIDEGLGGLFDAAEYEDPYSIERKRLEDATRSSAGKPASMPVNRNSSQAGKATCSVVKAGNNSYAASATYCVAHPSNCNCQNNYHAQQQYYGNDYYFIGDYDSKDTTDSASSGHGGHDDSGGNCADDNNATGGYDGGSNDAEGSYTCYNNDTSGGYDGGSYDAGSYDVGGYDGGGGCDTGGSGCD